MPSSSSLSLLIPVPEASRPVLRRRMIRPPGEPRRRPRWAAASSPAAANRRTSLIAAAVSHDARFSSRCIRSGDRSPACSAIVHPLRRGRSLTSADMYFPACCHVCVRAKQPRSAPISSALLRAAGPAPILAAAAASDSFVLTSTRSSGGCAHVRVSPPATRLLRPPLAAALLGSRM